MSLLHISLLRAAGCPHVCLMVTQAGAVHFPALALSVFAFQRLGNTEDQGLVYCLVDFSLEL